MPQILSQPATILMKITIDYESDEDEDDEVSYWDALDKVYWH